MVVERAVVGYRSSSHQPVIKAASETIALESNEPSGRAWSSPPVRVCLVAFFVILGFRVALLWRPVDRKPEYRCITVSVLAATAQNSLRQSKCHYKFSVLH
jgi:hypothetical protein